MIPPYRGSQAWHPLLSLSTGHDNRGEGPAPGSPWRSVGRVRWGWTRAATRGTCRTACTRSHFRSLPRCAVHDSRPARRATMPSTAPAPSSITLSSHSNRRCHFTSNGTQRYSVGVAALLRPFSFLLECKDRNHPSTSGTTQSSETGPRDSSTPGEVRQCMLHFACLTPTNTAKCSAHDIDPTEQRAPVTPQRPRTPMQSY